MKVSVAQCLPSSRRHGAAGQHWCAGDGDGTRPMTLLLLASGGTATLLKRLKDLTREQAIQLWQQLGQPVRRVCEPRWTRSPERKPSARRQYFWQSGIRELSVVIIAPESAGQSGVQLRPASAECPEASVLSSDTTGPRRYCIHGAQTQAQQ